MDVNGVISAIIVGAIIGALARLIKPGRQNISIVLTIIIGIVAALLGGFIAQQLLGTTSFIITIIIQLVLAVIGVGIVAGAIGLGYLTAPAAETSGVLDPAAVGVWLGVGSIVALAGAAIDALVSRRR